MPRHSRYTLKDRVINSALGFVFILKMLAYGVDMRYCAVLRYFSETRARDIITDFLGFLLILFLILYSPVCLAIWFYYGG